MTLTKRTASAAIIACAAMFAVHELYANDADVPILEARLVAIGIPGASAVAPVGTFLPGGPIPVNFPTYIQSGAVLDPKRILVGSTSNFGEPLSDQNQLPGSFLSIDPTSNSVLVIPPEFASGGGQASTLGGFVRMFSAQNPAFLNSINNPLAPTANFTGVSNPLGMSINNAFGRLWPANAPYGLPGIGSSTILDPPGEPLKGAPNPTLIGGVYAGTLTNRQPQVIPGGLNTGAVGTAFLGASPDGSGKAVFAVVCADGSIVQEHTRTGLDGLAPVGTVSALLSGPWNLGGDNEEHPQPRVGVLLNWSPSLNLYVSEPFTNSIAMINLTTDSVLFHMTSVNRIFSGTLNEPIDLAPVNIDSDDLNFASNTTLDPGSDFYVANRGDNTIVRMKQDGTVVAQRGIRLSGGRPLGALHLNGITTSPDGSRIWVTLSGSVPGMGNVKGAVAELPAF